MEQEQQAARQRKSGADTKTSEQLSQQQASGGKQHPIDDELAAYW
jgi:hypothetical protein